MDRADLDRSSSRASSVSGRSARSWNSLSPEERELASGLQSRRILLESHANSYAGSSNDSSSGKSQPRDRLQDAEAAERDIASRQGQASSEDRPRSGIKSPAAARSTADSRRSGGERRSGSPGFSGNRQAPEIPIRSHTDSSSSSIRTNLNRSKICKPRITRWKQPCGHGMRRQRRR